MVNLEEMDALWMMDCLMLKDPKNLPKGEPGPAGGPSGCQGQPGARGAHTLDEIKPQWQMILNNEYCKINPSNF